MRRFICALALFMSASAMPATLHQIIFILRPDVNGVWSIQDDGDHSSFGVHKGIGVVQGRDFLRVYFDPVFDKAGVVQVTTDDDFAGSINVGAGLGTQNVTFSLRAYPYTRSIDAPIDPARIWDYVRYNGGGNLWVTITMVNK